MIYFLDLNSFWSKEEEEPNLKSTLIRKLVAHWKNLCDFERKKVERNADVFLSFLTDNRNSYEIEYFWGRIRENLNMQMVSKENGLSLSRRQ